MTDNITPPPELALQWYRDADRQLVPYYVFVAECAAQWGAGMELDACCEWLDDPDLNVDSYKLRADRRSKPYNLKEQALEELNLTADSNGAELSRTQVDLIRRALEQLDD